MLCARILSQEYKCYFIDVIDITLNVDGTGCGT